MADDSVVLDTVEAAKLLGICVETVRRLARRGEMPSSKVGKDWRFRKDILLRWLEEQHALVKLPVVLLVDDEESVCRTFSLIVGRMGCRVRCAADGHEALALVAREVPDAIVLDLAMPKMDGPRFLEKLREIHPELPVIVATGYPDGELMRRALEHGPITLLTKPVPMAHLERALRLVVGHRLLDSRTPGERRGHVSV